MKKLLLAVVAAGFAANLSANARGAVLADDRYAESIIIEKNDGSLDEYTVVNKKKHKAKKERKLEERTIQQRAV